MEEITKHLNVTSAIIYILGVFTPKIIESIYNLIHKRTAKSFKRFILRRKMSALDNKNRKSVIAIDHAYPMYKESNISLKFGNEKFFLSNNGENCSKLDKSGFKLNKLNVFGLSITSLSEITGISNIEKTIKQCIEDISAETLNKIESGYIRFNGKMLGVRKINGGRSLDDEESFLSAELFETDYFTYLVMTESYKRMVSSGVNFCLENNFISLRDKYPFMPSFGLACFVIYDKGLGDEVFLTRRSKYLEAAPGKIHFSMNEAFSMKDFDYEEIHPTPSLRVCLFRGLQEELGLSKKYVSKYGITDLWLGLERCEIGVLSFVRIDFSEQFSFQDFINGYSRAQDSDLETESWDSIRIKDVHRYIRENQSSMSDGCLTGLNYLLSRHKEGFI